MAISRKIIYKPFSVLGIIVALHTIVVGYGLVFVDSVHSTKLYDYLDKVADAEVFGAAMIVFGIWVTLSYLSGKEFWITLSSYVQSLHWLFLFFAYALAGDIFVGLQNALFWAILSGYIAFCYKNRDEWVDNTP